MANTLVARMRRNLPDVTVISTGSKKWSADIHVPANKLMLSRKLAKCLKEKDEDILYLPSYARMLPTALRLWVLSCYTRRRIRVLLTMKSHMGWLAGTLLRWSKAEVIALSEEAWRGYQAVIGKRAVRLYAGVDTNRFVPVDAEKKAELKVKYGCPQGKPVVLHVGHMTQGRNLIQLKSINEKWHVVVVLSSHTQNEQDLALRAELEKQPNITIMDGYISRIEEIYQMADIYLFPVACGQSCIDAPLSALEAASCGIPVVATPYAELQALVSREGFYCIDSFDAKRLNQLLDCALTEGKSARESVLHYDWDEAIKTLAEMFEPAAGDLSNGDV